MAVVRNESLKSQNFRTRIRMSRYIRKFINHVCICEIKLSNVLEFSQLTKQKQSWSKRVKFFPMVRCTAATHLVGKIETIIE